MRKNTLLKGLSQEQINKIKSCKNQDEILALAKEEGVELTDEQLDVVSGGACTAMKCPFCGSKNVRFEGDRYVCDDCREFFIK